MDIGKCFKDAWGLFKLDLGPLIVTAIVGAVVIGVVAAFTLGASLAGVFATSSDGDVNGLAIGGLVVGILVLIVVSVLVGAWQYATLYGMLIARVREGRAAEYGDMSRYFGLIGAFIVANIVLGIIIGIGYVLLIIPGIIFTTWWLFTWLCMVDQKLGFGEAMSASKELASRAGFWNVLGAWIVGAIVWVVVSAVLGVIPYLGSIISMLLGPYALAYTVSMYFQARGEAQLIDAALGVGPAQPAMAAPDLPAPPAYQPATPYTAPPAPPVYQP
ncbi:MAG: hypothetical protein WC709_10870, partial [Thermoleophilia bacterium]